MKFFIPFTVLAISSFLSLINCEEEGEDFRFELLSPTGFRHSYRPTFDVHNKVTITLHGIINEKNTKILIGQYSGHTERHNNGWFVYENTRVPVSPGDTIYFWAKKNSPPLSYSTAIRRYDVPVNASRVSC